MPSTPWHSARLVRLPLLLGALAVVLIVPAASAHTACEHADRTSADGHRCAICRHLGDGTPLLASPTAVAARVPVAAVMPPPVLAVVDLALPLACGRSPPGHVPVS